MIKKFISLTVCVSLLTATLCGCVKQEDSVKEKSVLVSTTVQTKPVKTTPLSSKKVVDTVSSEASSEIKIGQPVGLRSNTKYWSTACSFGSGRNGIFNSENEYLKDGDYHINGIAIVDSSGNILSSDYQSRDELLNSNTENKSFIIEEGVTTMVHICVPGFTTGDIGWFNSSDVVLVDKPKTEESGTVSTKQAADIILDESQNSTVSVLLDGSGSVSEFSASIAGYSQKVTNAKEFIMFAEDAKVIDPSDYLETYVGGKTDIFKAMNLLDNDNYDLVVIVTDGYHNCSTELKNRSNIKKVMILTPVDVDEFPKETIEAIETKWENTEIIINFLTNN